MILWVSELINYIDHLPNSCKDTCKIKGTNGVSRDLWCDTIIISAHTNAEKL